MIIALDNSAFTLLVNPEAKPPNDPETGLPLTHAKARIDGLIDELGANDRLILPTPALAEALIVAADAAGELLDRMQPFARLVIAPFDQRAAVEAAMMHHEAVAKYGTKRGASSEPWQKVKFDRQIVAIARVHRADVLYSNDGKMCEFAQSVGLNTKCTWELPVPAKTPDLFDE